MPAGNQPERVAVSPDGKSVYVTDAELGLGGEGVSQYTVGAGGALEPKSPGVAQTHGEPIGVTLSADGASLYVANFHGYVSQFDVGAGGLLAAKTPATVLAGTGPPAEPTGIALLPDQAPLATFSAFPASAGSASAFDGSASSDPDGSVARYDWELGDGAVLLDAGAKPAHVYAGAGSYTVRLTVTDDAGCSTSLVFTGQTAYCAGGAQASSASTVVVPAAPSAIVSRPAPPPVISAARLTNKRFRVGGKPTAISARRIPTGTTFRFALSADAKLQIALTRSAPGRRRGGRCVAPTVRLERAHAKSCTRTLAVGTLTRSHEPSGTDSIPFSGRVASRPLSAHGYKALVTASNAGGRSRAVALAFTIVR